MKLRYGGSHIGLYVLNATRMRCLQLPNEPIPVGRAGRSSSPCALGLSMRIKPRLHPC